MSLTTPDGTEASVSEEFEHTQPVGIMANPKIAEIVDETVANIVDQLQIEPNRALEWVVRDGMEKLLNVAAKQDFALRELQELTDVSYSKINIEDIKHLDPSKYDDPQAVAQSMHAVLQAEAEKLITTSDFISDVRRNLDDMAPEVRGEFKNDLIAARKVAGKAIKGALEAYRYNNERHMTFSISHLPDTHLKSEVQPVIDRITPYLEPEH